LQWITHAALGYHVAKDHWKSPPDHLMTERSFRRIVTGHDKDGRAIDGVWDADIDQPHQ
jgi:hypothetical protein